jgi:hypothetical protein
MYFILAVGSAALAVVLAALAFALRPSAAGGGPREDVVHFVLLSLGVLLAFLALVFSVAWVEHRMIGRSNPPSGRSD